MDAISYIAIFLAGLFIYAGISRWVFRVNDHIENQEIMIQLLSQLLKQNGLTTEEINKLLNPKKK